MSVFKQNLLVNEERRSRNNNMRRTTYYEYKTKTRYFMLRKDRRRMRDELLKIFKRITLALFSFFIVLFHFLHYYNYIASSCYCYKKKPTLSTISFSPRRGWDGNFLGGKFFFCSTVLYLALLRTRWLADADFLTLSKYKTTFRQHFEKKNF